MSAKSANKTKKNTRNPSKQAPGRAQKNQRRIPSSARAVKAKERTVEQDVTRSRTIDKKKAPPTILATRTKTRAATSTKQTPSKQLGVVRRTAVDRGRKAALSEVPGVEKLAEPEVASKKPASKKRADARGASGTESAPKRLGLRIEVDPRRERVGDLVARRPTASQEKPMSVAQKNRAAAEAVFMRLTVPEPTSAPVPVTATVDAPLPFAARRSEDGGGSYTMRVSERDSLTTALRLAEGRDEIARAATELADRYQLPPDQPLLLKVMNLGIDRLTRLALEELLELEDRGRVRASSELRSTLLGLKGRDSEINELRQLLLEKIGVA